MLCFADIPGRPALLFEREWWRGGSVGDVRWSGRTGKTGERRNCGLDIIHKRRIKEKIICTRTPGSWTLLILIGDAEHIPSLLPFLVDFDARTMFSGSQLPWFLRQALSLCPEAHPPG